MFAGSMLICQIRSAVFGAVKRVFGQDGSPLEQLSRTLVALHFFQKINILIVNQCIIDMCGSFYALLSAVVEVGSTGMSREHSWDQFVCRIWHTRAPLWTFLVTSTYGILLTALERYLAVVYPIWYKVPSELLRL